ncbi:Calcium-independent phospholipase A2-gamma [Colletotrichum fructicola Nara gc5]|uniref:Calcium-independent phospholipase A2-gamma n=1 Tax=Colletotrichum fructicola (strain Nara gc5) TaxID=1213859 RepID=A0A7J6J5U9_COLFN|nr:Calcium-independent phospholipase A2-gamma [Colletotrichum fructicola Nara gc5]
MEGNHHQEWKKYPAFPLTDAATAENGDYVIHSDSTADIEAVDAEVQSKVWFRSPRLDADTIKRINRIQLHTKSSDQGQCLDKEAGTWTWFEIAIMADEQAETPRIKDGIKLTWESHLNVQAQSVPEERAGREFRTGEKMFGALEEGNVLAVQICAQYRDWAIYAEEGYLAIELGNPTDHTPVNFENVVSRTKSFQHAIMEMNEVLYPGMEQRRLPDIVFNASRIDTSETHQLRVLVIDGGGVRGLAALHILNKIMIRAHGEDYDAKNIKPCDVFDMICGTSTGGLIAIMLGRMKMKVSDCIKEYENFMDKVFPRGILDNKFLNDIPGVGYLLSGLSWNSIKTAMRTYMQDQEGKPADPEQVLLKDDDNAKCKVFVTATRKQDANSTAPVLLRSYVNPVEKNKLPTIKLWEAARATSAAPLYFKHVTVGEYTLVDGGLQANNPLGWAWNEVMTTFGPARTTSCFLSIGTGAAEAKAIPTIGLNWDLLKIKAAFLDALSALTTNTEITNVLFRSLINNFAPQSGIKKYWRFNVGDGWVDLVKKNDSWVAQSDSDPKPFDIALDDSGLCCGFARPKLERRRC